MGKKYAYSYLKFKNQDKIFEYLMKVGQLDYKSFKEKNTDVALSYEDDETSIKETTSNPDFFKEEFEKSSYCYFSPKRYSKQEWLNKKYDNSESVEVDQRYTAVLDKPINVGEMYKILGLKE